MANQWGRKETIIWPPHVPMLSYTAVATALLLTCLFILIAVTCPRKTLPFEAGVLS